MSEQLRTLLSITFAVFVFGSTFSIALAQSALGISLIVFIYIALSRRYNPFPAEMRPVYLSILLYVVWLWIASLANDNSYNSIVGTQEEWLFCVIPIGIYLMRSEKTRRLLLYALTAGVILISIYGMIQHFTGFVFLDDNTAVKAPDFGYMVSGQFSHRLTFGNYFGLISVFLLAVAIGRPGLRGDRVRQVILLAAVMGTIVTILSYSRGPIFSLILTLVVSGLVAGKRLFRFGVAVLVMMVAAILIVQPHIFSSFSNRMDRDLNDQYAGGRLFIWSNSAELVKQNPVFGVGPANFKNAYSRLLPEDIAESRKHGHAHNDLLNFAAIAGIPGSIFWLMLFMVVAMKLWHLAGSSDRNSEKAVWARAAFLATIFFLAASMTEATFADEEVRQGLMFIWAAGLAGLRGVGTENGVKSKKA